MKKKLRFIITIFITLILCFCISFADDINTENSKNNYNVNDNFNIYINLKNVKDLYSFQIELLFSKDTIKSADKTLGKQDWTKDDVFVAQNIVDNDNGKIKYAVTKLGDKKGDSPTTILKIPFTVVKKGDIYIKIDNLILVNSSVKKIDYQVSSDAVYLNKSSNGNQINNNNSKADGNANSSAQQLPAGDSTDSDSGQTSVNSSPNSSKESSSSVSNGIAKNSSQVSIGLDTKFDSNPANDESKKKAELKTSDKKKNIASNNSSKNGTNKFSLTGALKKNNKNNIIFIAVIIMTIIIIIFAVYILKFKKLNKGDKNGEGKKNN